MAKTQFEREHVLQESSNTFWRLGYNAASMQELFDRTGLKPGSIYLAFGNKEGLFKESLDYYARQSLMKLETALTGATSVEKGIYDVLMGFVEESCQSNYCSCFLVKSQLELSSQPELQTYISKHLRKIEALYARFLSQKYSEDDAKTKATSLMLHIFGVRVYGYHADSHEQIISGLRLSLPWLPWPI